MSWWRIFILTYIKNITTWQKEIHFYVTQKKIISFFVHHKVFVYNFHIAHCQLVDPLRSGPRNKETFNSPLLTRLIYRSSQQLLRAALKKRFTFLKTSRKGSWFNKTVSFFSATFPKTNTVAGISQGFYLYFKQFSVIVCNNSRRLSSGRFCKF